MVACNFHVLGNSRKYAYHTTESFLEFEEQGSGGGEAFELEIQRDGGIEFLRETDKSVLLKTFIIWT